MKARSFLLMVLLSIAVMALPNGAMAEWPQIATAPFARGFTLPVHVAHAGDGSNRVFVVEQAGVIKIVSNNAVLPVPFLDVTDRILFSTGGEQGLLSVAFPSQFAVKNYFYVNYTRLPDGATVVSRFRLTADPNVADPLSEEILLVIDQPFANHNGGQLAFSPIDGFLYIGMGDGGSGGDPFNFAQNLADLPGNRRLLGKMLRIDVESGAVPYAVPPTNPLLGGGISEIWATGLRNPFRFSFDRATGNLYIGDVGQGSREEIDFQPASSRGGENYGWRILEGSLCFNPSSGCVPPRRFSPPVTEYDHTRGCSVTGGFVYRGSEFPNLQGIYLFGDFCSGTIWGLRRNASAFTRRQLLDTAFTISSFGEGEDGSIFLADYASGNILRIVQAVAVLAPNGGETFASNGQETITWQTTGLSNPAARVLILFTRNGGLTWERVADLANDPGSVQWTVPAVGRVRNRCRIRVVVIDTLGRRFSDRSNAFFTIRPSPPPP